MDDLADKLKQVFSFGRPKKFNGPGQRLGTSAESPHVRVNRGQPGQPRGPDLARAAELEKKLAAVRQHQGLASQEGGQGFNPFQASTVSGNAFTTAVHGQSSPRDTQPQPKPAPKPTPTPSAASSRPPQPTAAAATTSATGQGYYEAVDDATVDAMQQHLVQVASTSGASQSLTTLQKILSNILKSPNEPKFRQVKMTNPRIREAVVDVPGALEFMATCGFEVTFVANQEGKEEGVVIFPDDGNLPHLQEGLQIIQLIQQGATATSPALPQTTATTSSSPSTSLPSSPHPVATPATAAAPSIIPVNPSGSQAAAALATTDHLSTPATIGSIGSTGQAVAGVTTSSQGPAQSAAGPITIDRQTKVVLPVTPDTRLPDWFFDRTSSELKSNYMSAMKKREQNSVLTTRAYKEKVASASTGPRPTHALIRIRFPEGVHLQGRFAAAEPVVAVHSWLESSLSHAGAIEYELVDHTRKPLPVHGTIRSCDLMPTALLSLRILHTAPGQQSSALSDAALSNAVVGDE